MGKKRNALKDLSENGKPTDSPMAKRSKGTTDLDESIQFLGQSPAITVKKRKGDNLNDSIQVIDQSPVVKKSKKKGEVISVPSTPAPIAITPNGDMSSEKRKKKKKKHSKKSIEKVDESLLNATPKIVKKDPWTLIEKGEATAASTLKGVNGDSGDHSESTELLKGRRTVDHRKPPRSCDGTNSQFVCKTTSYNDEDGDIVGWTKGEGQRFRDDRNKGKKGKKGARDSRYFNPDSSIVFNGNGDTNGSAVGNGNIFKQFEAKPKNSKETPIVSSDNNVINTKKNKKEKKGNGVLIVEERKVSSEETTTVEGIDYYVEEPDDTLESVEKMEEKRKRVLGIKMANLFDDEDFIGLESDESLDEDDGEIEEIADGGEEEYKKSPFFNALLGVEPSDDEEEGEDMEEDEEDDEEIDEEDEDSGDEEDEVDVSSIMKNASKVIELDSDDGIQDSDDEIEDDEVVDEDVSDEEDGEEEMDEEDDEEEEEEGDSSDGESVCSEESVEDANLGGERECGVVNCVPSSGTSPVDFTSFPFNDEDSGVTATRAFGWMIHSCDTQTFFDDFYQQTALIVKRNDKKYYGNLFSVKQLSELLEKEHMEYGVNINIAEYKDGKRFTMNGVGRVYAGSVLEHFNNGHSIQLVNPQTFSDNIWYLCDAIQEMFGCFVGANTYLTPAGSAGFAPHWDEIDAFLLQLEGRKYWKVYAPENNEDELPRESSGNFSDADMAGRTPCFEGWVETGDMLYIPRGFIHQATTSDVHSFHVTVSVGRRWAFADLLEQIMPTVLENLAVTRLKLRKSLPVGFLDMAGVADLEYRLEEQAPIKLNAPLDSHLSVVRRAMAEGVDSAVDMMGREFMKQALPPMLTKEEKKLSIIGSRSILKGKVLELNAKTRVKLLRRHAQRVIFESEEKCFITHRMANSRLYEGRGEQMFDIPAELVDSFSALHSSYPEWISLDELPSKRKQSIQLVHLLYTNGLLMVKN